MSEQDRKSAISATAKVFEMMFFVPLEVEPEGFSEEVPSESSPSLLRGEIEFRGKRKGKMKLFLPLDLSRAMAINFMGLGEESVSDAQVMDAVGECCNMICGNLVSEWDRKAEWEITLPHVEPASCSEMEQEGEPGLAIDFSGGDQRIRLSLQFET